MEKDISAITAGLEEMYQRLQAYNQRMANNPKHPRELPPEAKYFTGDKMAFINEVYKIALENPALIMDAVSPGKFIQDVKALKDLERMIKTTEQLKKILEDKIAAEEGTMTQTTTGTAQ